MSVTISEEEYSDLKSDSKFLDCLRSLGVDNWDGWDEAIDLYNEDEEDDQ